MSWNWPGGFQHAVNCTQFEGGTRCCHSPANLVIRKADIWYCRCWGCRSHDHWWFLDQWSGCLSFLMHVNEGEMKVPLHRWKTKGFVFPTLARLTRNYLAIPGSRIPSERAFSPAGLTLTKLWVLLEPDIAENCCMLTSASSVERGSVSDDNPKRKVAKVTPAAEEAPTIKLNPFNPAQTPCPHCPNCAHYRVSAHAVSMASRWWLYITDCSWFLPNIPLCARSEPKLWFCKHWIDTLSSLFNIPWQKAVISLFQKVHPKTCIHHLTIEL